MKSKKQIIDSLIMSLSMLQPMKHEYQDKLDKKIRLEFNYNSNHLEGNTLTYGETELLLIFDKTTGNHELREYEEMKAHDVAFELIKQLAVDKERPLTENLLKSLNEVLLVRPFWKEAITPDGQTTRRLITVGNYKEFPNSVRLQNGSIFSYTSPQETPIEMGELIQWYREEEGKGQLSIVELAALLHYRFVRIHPFDDGNGRISRLLMNYVLLKHNLPPVIIKSADKKNYLFALNRADAGDIDAIVEYISELLIWSLQLYIKAANGETLVDADDLNKEIAVWKRGAAAEKPSTLHRSDDLVYEVYNNGIKRMFEEFAHAHMQFFDMFYRSEVNSYINDNGNPGLEWLAIDTIPPEIVHPKDRYRNVWVSINLDEYKYNEKNLFSLNSILKVDFQRFNYIVLYNNTSTGILKSYDQIISLEEGQQIVADCVKNLFNQIQISSRKNKL